MIRDHRKLRAFELADALVVLVYQASKDFPKDEWFGLRSQMRRSAVSVPANIVEGSARDSIKDYAHFLNMAFASLRELGYYFSLASRLKYLSPSVGQEIQNLYSETARVLAALVKSIKLRK